MSDFYGSVSGFRVHHIERGNVTSAYDDAEVEVALLVASEWIDSRYRSAFQGYKVGQRDQLREWPRNGVIDREGYWVVPDAVPIEIDQATYEAALKTLVAPGSLTLDVTPNKYTEASVSGAVAVKYAQFGSVFDAQTSFATVEQFLSRLLHTQTASFSGDARRG